MSLNIHIKTRSLNDLRTKELRNQLPRCYGAEDAPGFLTGGEVCMAMGNTQWWENIDGNTNFERDSIRRPTPVVMWQKILDEAFGTYDMMGVSSYQLCATLPADELKEGRRGGY